MAIGRRRYILAVCFSGTTFGGFSLLCKVAEEPVYHGEAIWNAVSQYWPASVQTSTVQIRTPL